MVGAGALIARRVTARGRLLRRVARAARRRRVHHAAGGQHRGRLDGRRDGARLSLRLSAWWWSGSAALGCLVLGSSVAPRLHRLALHAPLLHRRRLSRVALRPVGSRAGLERALARHAVAAGGPADRDGVGAAGDRGRAARRGRTALRPRARHLLRRRRTVRRGLGERAAARDAAGRLRPRRCPSPGGLRAAGRGLQRRPAPIRPTAASPGWGPGRHPRLLLVFAPSFVVSPGLVQKTFAARSAEAARRAVLWNALALAAFAFVPAVLGMAARAAMPGSREPGAGAAAADDGRAPAVARRAGAGGAVRRRDLDGGRRALHARDLAQPRPVPGGAAPAGDDAELLRVGRLAAAAGGALAVGSRSCCRPSRRRSRSSTA